MKRLINQFLALVLVLAMGGLAFLFSPLTPLMTIILGIVLLIIIISILLPLLPIVQMLVKEKRSRTSEPPEQEQKESASSKTVKTKTKNAGYYAKLNNIDFYYERKMPGPDETKYYGGYCYWLGVMYRYYLKPVISEKMRYLRVIVTEISENRVEKPVDKYTEEGEAIYLYIHYGHEALLGKPPVSVQQILLDVIHNGIMEYVTENHLDSGAFTEAYNCIIENNFLFEKKYLSPASNGTYTAQMSFKFDFQNRGDFYDGVFVEIYRDNELIKKIEFFKHALSAIKGSMTYREIEWIDEKNLKVYYGEYETRFYWKINIDGTVEYENVKKDNAHDIFSLGMDHYEGYKIPIDKAKGYTLIQKAAEMGYYYAEEWMKRYKLDSDYSEFWIPPKNY